MRFWDVVCGDCEIVGEGIEWVRLRVRTRGRAPEKEFENLQVGT
jgi:hypothetical protein